MSDNLNYKDYRSSLVKSSWYRCKHNYGFDRDDKIDAIILSEPTLKEHQEAFSEICYFAQKVVNSVRQIAKDGDYSVLLTDQNAVALESYYDSPESEICAEYGLINGSKWDEHLIGTNGIGTALASNSCLTINGADHYANCLKNFTCTAAPIYGVQNKIVGSLNISRLTYEDYLESYFTHNFIREAANQITANIFIKNYSNENILALSLCSLVSLYETKALLAFDDSGTILDATIDCVTLLDLGVLEDLIGNNIFSFLGIHSEKFLMMNNQEINLNDDPSKKVFIKSLNKKRTKNLNALKTFQYKQKKRPTKPEKLNLDKLAGSDKTMKQSVRIARNFLDKKIPILLLGETGVGKDAFSNALHFESARAENPFVAFNCATVPESLIDSELFGYNPGTFTDGLKEGKVGKILASDKGTLFLDEIGDMPHNLQARLLRVLEDREVTQLGSVKPKKVDLNIICATNKNIPELIEKGKFREDLYFRIKGMQLQLPPLRERTNIKEITAAIVNNETNYSYQDIKITEDVWSLFLKYSWPGNIRELKSTLLYALAVMRNNIISLKELPEDFFTSSIKSEAKDYKLPPDHNSLINYFGSSENLIKLKFQNNKSEHDHIIQTLEKNRWNITATAKNLGISRSTLHRKMQKHGILSPHNIASKQSN